MRLRLRHLWIAAVTLGAACPVMGQTSSLMARRHRAATSQPHRSAPAPQLTPAYSGWRRRPISPATEALQRASLMAVVPEPPKSFKVHDLITIIVREQKKYEADAKLDNEKEATFDAMLDAWFRIHDHKWQQQAFAGGKPQIKASFGGEFKGDSKAEREDTFITRITAEVVDVKPNGNLVLEGNAYIKNDEEEQILRVSGTCRSLDVTPDNTILSTQLADKQMKIDHKGSVRDSTRRGWIPRALDYLRPF